MGLFMEKGGMITIIPELQKIDAFGKILRRDSDKSKRNAYNELAFVYFMADFTSPYLAYGETKREELLRKDLRLGKEWKFDSTIKEAIEKYKELSETPAIKTLRTVKETLTTTVAVTESMRKKVEESLKKYEDSLETENTGDITVIIQAVTSLISLAEKIPKTIHILEQLEDKAKSESLDTKIYGGGKANLFED